jgi:hypothetical protein
MAQLPPVQVKYYSDHAAMAVLSRLDASDQTEADLVRGAVSSHLQLFADWRALEPARVVSLVLCAGSEAAPMPFAVLGLSNTGQAGVASAALLARDHIKFKRHLMATCLLIRDRIPVICAENGIHRIEARTWGGHPRASLFLRACGFAFETDLHGCGRDGRTVFRQFAWTNPNIR